MPHGALEEVFPDVFVVRSSFRAGAGVVFERNMTVLRQGGELVILNSARLGAEGEAALEKLGKVTHVVRLAAFHGADDAYFVERFGATLWGAPGTRHAVPGKDLLPDAHPFTSASVFRFEHAKEPESAILLPVDGGALVTGDSYQNWTTFAHCSWLARRLMPFMGFGPAMIGKPWRKRMGPGVREDFARLRELPFRHLIPGHGTVLRDVARDRLPAAIAARFPEGA
jgi:hypothetical protein